MNPDTLIYTDEYLRVRAVPKQHTSTYIFCHGKGQIGAQWQSLVEPLRKQGHCDHVAFIFPYLDFPETTNESHIDSAAALVRKIVAEEIVKGIPAHRIAVGGSNEGFEVGVLATVADSTKTAGVVGISKGLQYSQTIAAHKGTMSVETQLFAIFRSAETRDGTENEVLKAVGQPVGAVVHSSARTSGVSPIVSYSKRNFERVLLIS